MEYPRRGLGRVLPQQRRRILPPTFDAPIIPEDVSSRIAIRQEFPPEDITFKISNPKTGRAIARWSSDDPNPDFSIAGAVLEDEIPGGWKTMQGTMARNPRQEWFDIAEYNELEALAPGNQTVWRGFIDKRADVSGDYLALQPAALGPQSILNDNKVKIGFIHSLLDGWGEASTQRQKDGLELYNWDWSKGSVDSGFADVGASGPSLLFKMASYAATKTEVLESWFYGDGIDIGAILYDFIVPKAAGTSSVQTVGFISQDDRAKVYKPGASHVNTPAANQSVSISGAAGYKYAAFQFAFLLAEAAGDTAGDTYGISWPKVIGNTGLPVVGTWPNVGYFAQQMLIYLINNHASPLEASINSVESEGFIVPQAWYPQEETVADIAKDIMKYELMDWFVYDENLFERRVPGSYGKFWKASIDNSSLNEVGIDSQRLWRSISVQWQDVSGRILTAGPLGDGTAHVTSGALEITDPDHPAVKADRTRHDTLVLNFVSNPAEAIATGQRFLEEANRLSRSGSATLPAYVMDQMGVMYPSSRVKSGDWIAFYNASDKGYRKIVHKSYALDTKQAEIDLDAPPSGLEALLERLQVGLAPRGVS